MNLIDFIIIALLILFVIDAIDRSFIAEMLDFISFLLAFFLALRFYNLASTFYQINFHTPHSLANVLGFITVWFLAETVFFLFCQVLIPKVKSLSNLDHQLKYFAIIPAFFRGLIFVSLILVLVGTFPINAQIKIAVNKSKLGLYILSQTQSLETPLKNVFGGLTQDTLTFLTIKPKSNESVNLGFQTTQFGPNQALETEMISLVNSERVTRGLTALTFDPSLRKIAEGHSTDMFERGYFSHYSPEGKTVADRAKEENIDFQVIGENLAYAPSLALAHKGLMDSEGHRANILSGDFNKIGIGIMDSSVYGLMITQVFSN